MDDLLQQAEDHHKKGNTPQAEVLCRQALDRMPGNIHALWLLGVLRFQAGFPNEAVSLLRRAVEIAPEHPGSLDALSAALMAAGDPAGAEIVLRRSIELDSDLPAAQLRLGLVLASQGKWEESVRAFRHAIVADPQSGEAHYLLGDALTRLNRYAEATASFLRALALGPAKAEMHTALGHALQELGLHEAARTRYERALALDPSFAIARHNLGLVYLQNHDFGRGWPIYEQRFQCAPARAEMRKDAASLELFESLPRWQGPGTIEKGDVGIWAEQGIGDQLLYSTLIPELERAGLPLVYEVDHRLLEAYRRAFPAIRFVPIEDPPQPSLRQASRVLLAGSVPGLFRQSLTDFARQPKRLLSALPDRVEYYRTRLNDEGPGLKVALSWRSTRKAGTVVTMKSATLAELMPVLEVAGVHFVDVQYGDTESERAAAERATGLRLRHFDEVDYFGDLEEVLAILEACDLVITTSNATAHLAGALGKRTWLLYPSDNPPFHYWAPHENGQSLWYPSVEIISSLRLGNWRSLAREVATRLRQELAQRGAEQEDVIEPARETKGVLGDAIERAKALRLEGRLAEAVAVARHELELAPRNARALTELAHALRWEGRLDEARAAATQAIAVAPDLSAAWFNLGAVQVEMGDVASGIESYRRTLALDASFAEAWSNLGDALGIAGDGAGAIEACLRAVGANPQLAPAWTNLGNTLLAAGQISEAVSAAQRAVALAPEFALGWISLCNARRKHGDIEQAVHAGERAVALASHSAEAWSNYGCALLERGALEHALAAHRRALDLQPDNARVLYNHALALERGQQHAAAIAGYRRAVEVDPDFAGAHLRLACALLTRGDFAEGWPEYEWRWREEGARPQRYTFTPWTGERAPGRRLLLWGEQGLGDELIYAGMVGELVATGLEITLEVDERLVGPMKRSFPGVSVAARSDSQGLNPADFDWQCPLGRLGRWLRPSFASFPSHHGYLKADPQRVARLSTTLRAAGPDRIIGISWMSANREIGSLKSSTLESWASVLKTPQCRFVDLQYGDTTAARRELQTRHGVSLTHLDEVDLFNDIEGLAALCAACDLVITVSNVTAHVAGALGRPVWLLAPAANGRIWYWFAGREDSPWYPSMRIITHHTAGDWAGAFDRVARELGNFAAG